MPKRDYERILASLNVVRNHVKHVNITKSVRIADYKNIDNKIIVLHKGEISWNEGSGKVTMKEGDMFFLPELSDITITYGGKEPITIDNNQFTNHQDQYTEELETQTLPTNTNGVFSYVSFSAKVYEAIDLFKFVNIPAFKIEKNSDLHALFQNIINESEGSRLGKNEILKNLIENLVVELLRHIIENHLFLDKLALKAAALTDLRLATLFKYIAIHISGDLSNKVLGDEIGLSKDYVGQYFKNITGINLQRYIETIRLKIAVGMLKNNPSMKIKAVAIACGFSDLAYFCRKFRTLWGTTARKMRVALATKDRD